MLSAQFCRFSKIAFADPTTDLGRAHSQHDTAGPGGKTGPLQNHVPAAERVGNRLRSGIFFFSDRTTVRLHSADGYRWKPPVQTLSHQPEIGKKIEKTNSKQILKNKQENTSLQRLYSQGKPKGKLNICCAPQTLRNRQAAGSNPQSVDDG